MALMFSSGRDALSVVAEPSGFWNWVFIGPDATELPVIGGGNGSIEEMQECLAAHTEYAVIFGLLRVRFGSGSLGRDKFIFITASNEDSEGFKAVQVGKQMAEKSALYKEFGSYCNIVVTLEVKRPSELTLGSMVPTIQKKVTTDGGHAGVVKKDCGAAAAPEEFTEESFKASLEEDQRRREEAAAAESDGEDEATQAQEEAPVVDDEELMQEVEEAKAAIEGEHRKTVAPSTIVADTPKPQALAIPSSITAPEEPPRLSGLLLKQATNFFAEWQLRAFEVSRGRIRYWCDWASKTAGYRPKYEYNLLNAQLDLIRTSDSRFQLTLKGSKAVDRAPYLLMANIGAFAGPTEAKYAHTREDWVLALVQHTVYAKKDLAYRRASQMVEKGGA